MNKEEYDEYLNGGGKFYKIRSYDIYRDGGTGVIVTKNDGELFVHKHNNTIHYKYPPSKENIIIDRLTIKWLKRQINNYTQDLNWQIDKLNLI